MFIIYYKMTRYKRGVSVSGLDFGRERMEIHVLNCNGMWNEVRFGASAQKGKNP